MTDNAPQSRLRIARKITAWIIGMAIAYYLVHGFAVRFNHGRPPSPPIDPKMVAGKVGQFNEQQGVMTVADYTKLDVLRAKIGATGRISDADLSWALGLLNHPLAKGEEPAQLLHVQVIDTLLRAQFLTPGQRNRIYLASAPMAETKSQSGLDKIEFATVVGTLHDPRGIPTLKTLAKDPRPAVSKAANLALDAATRAGSPPLPQ